MNHSTPGLPVHHQLPEFTQTHVHWVSDAIQPSHPLRPLLLLPPIPPSIRVFSNESTLRVRWPKHWSFSFSIIPSKEIPGLIYHLLTIYWATCLIWIISFKSHNNSMKCISLFQFDIWMIYAKHLWTDVSNGVRIFSLHFSFLSSWDST